MRVNNDYPHIFPITDVAIDNSAIYRSTLKLEPPDVMYGGCNNDPSKEARHVVVRTEKLLPVLLVIPSPSMREIHLVSLTRVRDLVVVMTETKYLRLKNNTHTTDQMLDPESPGKSVLWTTFEPTHTYVVEKLSTALVCDYISHFEQTVATMKAMVCKEHPIVKTTIEHAIQKLLEGIKDGN